MRGSMGLLDFQLTRSGTDYPPHRGLDEFYVHKKVSHSRQEGEVWGPKLLPSGKTVGFPMSISRASARSSDGRVSPHGRASGG